ncbi:MAG: hypothetical protein ABR518_05665 [Actinomycetota bacterium]
MTATAVAFLAPNARADSMLSVTKTSTDVDAAPLQPGDVIEYSIQISNAGPDAATGVNLTDVTPSGTTYVPDSATINGGPPIAGASNPFEDGEAIPDIAATQSATATFRVTVDATAADGTTVDNTASAYAANDPNATQASPQTSSTSDTVVAPVLSVEKTAEPAEEVDPGETITYTIVVTNSGGDVAVNPVLRDDTPENTEYVANSATIDDGTTFADPSTNPFADPGHAMEDLAAGDSTTATFQVTANSPLPNGTEISNTATVGADNHDDVAGTAESTVTSTPGLTMAKTAFPAEGQKITPGAVINYTIVVTNAANATEAATEVMLTDPTPANTTYVQGSAKLGNTPIEGDGNPLADGHSLPDLAPGESASVTFDVKVASPLAKGTVISNLAKLNANNHPEVADDATHTVDSAPILKVDVSADPPLRTKVPGGRTISYEVKISNDPAATDSLSGVVVTAPTPKGTTFVSGSLKVDGTAPSAANRFATGVAAAAAAPNPLSSGYALGNIAPGATRIVSYAVRVNESADTIEGTVTVQAANVAAVITTTAHRGPAYRDGSGGGGEGGGGGDDDGLAFGPSSDAAASGGASGELAFTGLDLARLLTLAMTLVLVGWTLLARGRSAQRRLATARLDDDGAANPGFPAWDRWSGAWFFPNPKK